MDINPRDGVRIPLGLLLYIEFLNAGCAYFFLQFSLLIPAAFATWHSDKLGAIGAFLGGIFMTGCGLLEVFLFIYAPLLDFRARRHIREQHQRSNQALQPTAGRSDV